MMRERFASVPLPVQAPLGESDHFRGIVDLVRMRLVTWRENTLGAALDVSEIPEDIRAEAEARRERLLETVAEADDGIAEKYLAEEPVTEAELIRAIRKATVSLKIVPVLCGAALRNKGVQLILDAVVDYLPSPEDIPPVRGVNPVTKAQEERPASDRAPFTALAFKVAMMEGRKITYVRIYSGLLKAGDEVFNATKGRREKVARLLKMHASKRERIDAAGAGDIIAVAGLKEAQTGDTLCSESKPLILESIEFYNPVISQAIEAKTPADQEKLPDVLAKISEEDPTLKVKYDEETAQTVISGMGELHLEVVVDRLQREYNIHVNTGKPRVVYRETIQKAVEAEGRFERELGEKRHFGHVRLALEPLARGAGVEIRNELAPETVPAEFHPVIEESIGEAVLSGVVAGYPVLDIRVRITGGSVKEGESSAIGYRIATQAAFREGCSKADPVLLEPIMRVDVLTPKDFMGEVIGDLNARRGEVESVNPKGPVTEIRADVPLRALFGYSTDLRSATQGRAVFSMQFLRYDKA